MNILTVRGKSSTIARCPWDTKVKVYTLHKVSFVTCGMGWVGLPGEP